MTERDVNSTDPDSYGGERDSATRTPGREGDTSRYDARSEAKDEARRTGDYPTRAAALGRARRA